MNIEKEPEHVIEMHKGRTVDLFEVRVTMVIVAHDGLAKIRHLKSEVERLKYTNKCPWEMLSDSEEE